MRTKLACIVFALAASSCRGEPLAASADGGFLDLRRHRLEAADVAPGDVALEVVYEPSERNASLDVWAGRQVCQVLAGGLYVRGDRFRHYSCDGYRQRVQKLAARRGGLGQVVWACWLMDPCAHRIEASDAACRVLGVCDESAIARRQDLRQVLERSHAAWADCLERDRGGWAQLGRVEVLP